MIKRKVLHVITTTGVGGAENMLYKYLSNSDKDMIQHGVISLTGIDIVGAKIEALNIPVHGLTKPIYTLRGIKELHTVVKNFKPDVIQSWLYHSDLVCLVLKLFLRFKLCWNIRSYKVYKFKKSTGLLVKLLALFSRIPDVVIINSLASRDYHKKIWYRPKKWEYIPNGFEVSAFKKKDELDFDIRKELKISPQNFIIGMVARYSNDKDHHTFLKACSLINRKLKNVHFVMVGLNIDNLNFELLSIIKKLGLQDRVHMLGKRDDIPEIIPIFDVLCSSSLDEAFPNVVGEAMSAAIPCVVTDVGDCSVLVGDTGKVVPPGDHKSISEACLNLLKMPEEKRIKLGKKARTRISKKFSIQRIANQYDQIYLRL